MVESLSTEQQTEMEYDAFIKEALDREVKKHFRDAGRLMKKRSLFCEISEEAVDAFEDVGSREAYDLIGNEFIVLEYTVTVRDDALYDALSQLDGRDRDVLLLAYWLDMSDGEISDATNIPRRTVNEIRRKAYKKTRKLLEDSGYGANTFFPKSGA